MTMGQSHDYDDGDDGQESSVSVWGLECPMDFVYENSDPWKRIGSGSPWRGTTKRGGWSEEVMLMMDKEMELDGAAMYEGDDEEKTAPTDDRTDNKATANLSLVPKSEKTEEIGTVVTPPAPTVKASSPALPHPLLRKETPYLLSGYLNLFFSASILCSILYVILKTLITLSSDISSRRNEYTLVNTALRQDCKRHFFANGCHLETRMPALEGVCREWQVCLEGVDDRVGKARVAAEIMAEVVNSLIEPISIKTFTFFLILLFGSMAMTNMTYVAMRAGSQSAGQTVPHEQRLCS